MEREAELFNGDVFYFMRFDRKEKLEPAYFALRDRFSCVFQKEYYGGDFGLEIMPENVSKATAVLKLKELVGADKIVAFGDGKNDIPMFRAADERYAVQNADPELKAIATGVIGGNDRDGVAVWLLKHAEFR